MTRLLLMFSLALTLAACSEPKPTPIDYGRDACVRCRMSISDSKYGAEAVSTKGKTYKFDSPECMLGWYAAGVVTATEIHSLWVTDFIRPGELIDAKTAVYLESDMLRSPMGMNYAAFRSDEERRRARFSYPGNDRDFRHTLSAAKEW
jgi:copper chaperone NosL